MLQCLTSDVGFLLAAMPAWMSSAWSILLLVFGFSLVVFVHELGHFAAAKWAGVRVETFAVGFGRELFGFTKGETRYSFSILPLGGYVKMLGQEDFVVDKSGELKVKEDESAFTNKSIGKRMVIITAGVVMNLLFAAVAFTIVAMVGLQQPPAIVGYASADSPAGRAGLQPGDRIEEINGDTINSFGELSTRIALSDPGEYLELKVRRDGKLLTPSPRILPEYVEDQQIRQAGVGPAENTRVWQGFLGDPDNVPADALRKGDLIVGLMTADGKKSCENLGEVLRAMVAANGEPVELVVQRPADPDKLTEEQLQAPDPYTEATEVTVKAQAFWLPLPYKSRDRVSASFLGLLPRMTVLTVLPDKTFAKAGVMSGDVITRIGNRDYPTYAELKELIQGGDGKEIPIVVRRSEAANHGLAAETGMFCVEHREALITAASEGLDKARGRLARLAAGVEGLQAKEVHFLGEKLAGLQTHADWRKWFENVDIHELGPIKPSKPFALFSDPPPTIDAQLKCLGEDHLVVADVIKQFGDRKTPAHAAGIPRGAVILSVDGQPVKRWHELTNALRAKAGTQVTLTYRIMEKVHTTAMAVPNCPQAALGLGTNDRIVKIDGKDFAMIKPEGKPARRLNLPDWRATESLLQDAVGKTVEIEAIRADGSSFAGSYAVTPDGTDPWMDRVRYLPRTFVCYPLLERHPIRNPALALVSGVKQAHGATMQTIQSIRHMLFTRKVGISKVSGPVGIMRLGTKVADTGMLNLLWFLGLISANLAVINFLPLPIVDGGLFLFLLLEKIRGEPVSIKTQVATQLVGIALIITVFVLVTYQDILNWVTGA